MGCSSHILSLNYQIDNSTNMKIIRHLPILLIFLSCNNSQQELFSINFPHINNHYKLLEIEKEDNLVSEPLIIESIKALFSKDANSNPVVSDEVAGLVFLISQQMFEYLFGGINIYITFVLYKLFNT